MAITNVLKLHSTLARAGLNICGVDSDGVISWVEPPTKSQSKQAEKILSEFVDTPEDTALVDEKISKLDTASLAKIVESIAIQVGLASADGKMK